LFALGIARVNLGLTAIIDAFITFVQAVITVVGALITLCGAFRKAWNTIFRPADPLSAGAPSRETGAHAGRE
jgi:hypothetical protein